MNRKQGFLRKNGLSLAFILLAILSIIGQAYMGWQEHTDFLFDHHVKPLSFGEYLLSGHFIQATFENWESEFLQMALFVVMTIFLYQQGSSESRKLDDDTDKEGELIARPDSPWPVKRGGVILFFYKHSLSISLFLLFIFSFLLHWYGSWVAFNEQQILESKLKQSFLHYLGNTRFWFESFQNWQSEFLSVFAIVFLSIYLRQAGSPQSKAVNASNEKTGEN